MIDQKLYGVTGLFDSPDEIIRAAKEVKEAGYKNFDVNTPYPVHGMDRAMGLSRTKVGFLTLFFGFSGTAFILLFMFWTMSVDYPMVIGGKPFFSLPAFIPITFETTVLLGAIATVFGMLAAFFNLPSNNHPLHDTDYMKHVSGDKYGVVIEADDPNFDEDEVTQLLKKLGSKRVDSIFFPPKETVPILQKRFIIFLILVAALVSLGTYVTLNKVMYMEPFHWMSDQDRLSPQQSSTVFADGFGMRKPVDGTVARGFIPYPYKGIAEPKEVLNNPLLSTKEVLDLGQRKYFTYCSPCHGDFGDGDSRLRGQFPNPPTLHSDRGRGFSDGMIYHIMVNGQNVMPSYQYQTTSEERWAIVHYVRALQRAKNAKISDLEMIKRESVVNVE